MDEDGAFNWEMELPKVALCLSGGGAFPCSCSADALPPWLIRLGLPLNAMAGDASTNRSKPGRDSLSAF